MGKVTQMAVPGYEKRSAKVRKGATALKKALLIARRNGLTSADVNTIYRQVETEQEAKMQQDLMRYNFTGEDRNDNFLDTAWRAIRAAFH